MIAARSAEPTESEWDKKKRQRKAEAEAAEKKKAEEQDKLARKAAAAEEGYTDGQGDDADEFAGQEPPPMH